MLEVSSIGFTLSIDFLTVIDSVFKYDIQTHTHTHTHTHTTMIRYSSPMYPKKDNNNPSLQESSRFEEVRSLSVSQTTMWVRGWDGVGCCTWSQLLVKVCLVTFTATKPTFAQHFVFHRLVTPCCMISNLLASRPKSEKNIRKQKLKGVISEKLLWESFPARSSWINPIHRPTQIGLGHNKIVLDKSHPQNYSD